MSRRRRQIRVGDVLPTLVAVLALAACQASPSASASASAPVSAAAASAQPAPSDSSVIAGPVDIGGRSLHLECRGTGSPTILYLHGYGGLGRHGAHLFDYAAHHRVCVYDRANLGGSDPVADVQTGADIVADLASLLEAAEVPGPYLLVASSHGGLIAEVFAGAHPDDVAGMVLIDASLHADADVDRYFAGQGEFDLVEFQAEYEADLERTTWTIHDEAKSALSSIPDVPITYLVALRGNELPPEADAIWGAGLAELLAISSNGQRVEVDGPHDLPPESIHAAIDEILTLLDAS